MGTSTYAETFPHNYVFYVLYDISIDLQSPIAVIVTIADAAYMHFCIEL